MTPEAWHRVEELFDQAVALAPEERDAWLDGQCHGDEELKNEVQSLLHNDLTRGRDPLQSEIRSSAGELFRETTHTAVPERAGPYRLIRELGRGGMGAVYLGSRDDEQYQIDVAIKLVNPGTGNEFTLQRFRRERQILANLDHPNVARLLDGGTTEAGMPYIVMEYIDGMRIADYCREHSRNVDHVLQLFLPVCAAVEHAHRNFVVHRDIKPSNILVTHDGTPKLLDFGISKLLDVDQPAGNETVVAGLRMLTPDYASPEQVRGEAVTIVSDVYSLGAVLYELLTGAKPHDLSGLTFTKMEDVISDEDVRRPSVVVTKRSLARKLQGDLDTILLRALDKDPRRRYATVSEFADDIKRYLAHLPVHARPDTIAYRIRKLVRRRRGTVLATAAVAASLIVGAAVAWNQARIANERLQQVRRLANTFVFDVHDAVRDLPGATKARRLIVETGLQYLDSLAGTVRGDTSLQSELANAYLRIAEIQGDTFNANLGKPDDAVRSLEKARVLVEAVLAKEPNNYEARKGLATIYFSQAKQDYAQRNLPKAMQEENLAAQNAEPLLKEKRADDSLRRMVAETYMGIGLIQRATGDSNAAAVAASRGLALLRESATGGNSDPELRYLTLGALATLGAYEVAANQISQGTIHMRESAEGMDQLVAEFPENTLYQRQQMLSWSHVADVLSGEGQTEEAVHALEHSVAIARKMFAADQADARAGSDLGIALTYLAEVLPEAQYARKQAVLAEAIQMLRNATQRNPKNVQGKSFLAEATFHLGDAYSAGNDKKRAVSSWFEGMAMADQLTGTRSVTLVDAYTSACRRLGQDAGERGDRKVAEGYAKKVQDFGGLKGQNPKANVPRVLAAQGSIYYALARSSAATGDDSKRATELLHQSAERWTALSREARLSVSAKRWQTEVQAEIERLDASANRTH